MPSHDEAPLSEAPSEARQRFERWIRDLAAFGHRGAGTANEKAAASYLLAELQQLGIEGHTEPFVGYGTLALRCTFHVLVAAVAAYFVAEAPLLSAGVALLALVSMLVEFATRGIWLSRFLPRIHCQNVVAKIAALQPKKRILLVAHYDTQQTGLLWFLFQYLAPLFWVLPTWLKPPFLPIALTIVAHLVLAVAVLLHIDITEAWYWLFGFYVGFLLLVGEWAIHTHVPGAGDNASGVAAILSFVAEWQKQPRDDVELTIVFPSAEEAGLLGSMAWADAHRQEIAALPTEFLIMDNLGMGRPRYLGVEVPMVGWPTPYPPAVCQVAQQVAEEMELFEPGAWAVPAPGDGLTFLKRGIPGMSILSFHRWGYMPFYHLKGDTAEHLDFDAAWLGVRYGWRLLTRMAEPDR